MSQVARKEVQHLSDKVTVVTDHTQTPVVIDSGGHVDVSVIMQNGQTFDRSIEKATGTPTYPLSDHDLQEKFRVCTVNVLSDTEIETAISGIYGLEDLTSINGLLDMLRVGTKVSLGA